MRYGPEITKQICEELKKVPLIRHVCAKFGIDHSTFYRWMALYPTFNKDIHASLYYGREHTTGAAESVILKGIQREDYRSASFWLTHNEMRYMQKDKAESFARLVTVQHQLLNEPPEPDEITFEKVFEMFLKMEKYFSFEQVREITKCAVEFLCRDDKNLLDILYASYGEWKTNRKQVQKFAKESGYPDPYPPEGSE